MPKPLSAITIDDLKEWAQKQPRDRRNPVDPGSLTNCLYVGDNGTDHCIAGQFFADHGVSNEVMLDWDAKLDAGGYSATEAASAFGMGVHVRRALGAMQTAADIATGQHRSAPWGHAIDALMEKF